MPKRKALGGWEFSIEPEKWLAEMDYLTEEDVDEIVDILAEADNKNMLVNEVMAELLDIVKYQKDIAIIMNTSPTTVGKRLRNQIGALDRIHPEMPEAMESSIKVDEEIVANPYTKELRRVLNIFQVYGTTIDKILRLYIERPEYYDTPEGFFSLLRMMHFSKKRAGLVTMHFFDLPYPYDPAKDKLTPEAVYYV